MKKSIRFLSILLALLICIGAFASCSGDETAESADTSDTESTEANGGDDSESSIDSIPVEMLSQFKIVYPQESEALFYDVALKMVNAIKAKYGVTVAVSTDFIREGSETFCEEEYEILIGGTDREGDDEFISALTVNDYGYALCGTKIVICGGNDYASTLAVEDFIYYVINTGNLPEGIFYSEDCDLLSTATYALSSLKINGVDFTEYSVVYPAASTGFEKKLAIRVSEVIKRFTGKEIVVKSDSLQYSDGYEILIGKTGRHSAEIPAAASGCMYSSGKLITLTGDTTYAKSQAVEAFLTLINDEAVKSKDVSVSISDTVMYVQTQTNITTMTFNVLTADVTSTRKAGVSSMILQYLPDILGTQEANPTWIKYLENEFSTYYERIGDGRDGGDNGEHTAIFYAKERFELLDSGTKWLTDTPDEVSIMAGANYRRIFTYAELKDLSTGDSFLVINTHLDIASDAIRKAEALLLIEFLADYTDIPVLLMGDMNFKSDSGAYELVDGTCFIAADKLTENINAALTIDWIFVTENNFDVSLVRLCNERIDGYYPSDHYPVYAEITVAIPDGGVNNEWGVDINDMYPDEYLDIAENAADTVGITIKLPDLLNQ